MRKTDREMMQGDKDWCGYCGHSWNRHEAPTTPLGGLGACTNPTCACGKLSYADPRDCQHGKLARSCDLCEKDVEITRLTAMIDNIREWTGISDSINTLKALPAIEEPARVSERYCLECSEAAEHHSPCDYARSASVYHSADLEVNG